MEIVLEAYGPFEYYSNKYCPKYCKRVITPTRLRPDNVLNIVSMDSIDVSYDTGNRWVLVGQVGNNRVYFRVTDDEMIIGSSSLHLLDKIYEMFKEKLRIDDPIYVHVKVLASSDTDLDSSSFNLSRLEFVRGLDETLFTKAGVDLEHLKTFWSPSNTENLLIVSGKPGTGKSKLVAWLLSKITDEYYDIVIVKGLTVIGQLVSQPSFIFSSRNTVFVFDDLDFVGGDLTRKSDPTVSDFISLLLSASDGILPTKNKFIVTTNIPIKEIDEALLRPGRLFSLVHLKPIKEDGKEMTIAEYVYKRYSNKCGKRVGF